MDGRSSLHGVHSATHACMHACVNKAWSAAGRSCCCFRHCKLILPLCQEGLASPVFQRRLRRLSHLSSERAYPPDDEAWAGAPAFKKLHHSKVT
eukprot:1138229-Pelagomonas_calceolata.AAC.5